MARSKAKRPLHLFVLIFLLFVAYACRLASLVLPLPDPAENSQLLLLTKRSFLQTALVTATAADTDEEGSNDDSEYYDGIDNGCWEWNAAEKDVFCSVDYCTHVATTTLYCSCCGVGGGGGSPPRIIRPLLITGTPRSGTVYLSTLLSSLGLHMGLDTSLSTYHGGMVSWAHVFPDTHPDLHFTMRLLEPVYYRHVIQLVRDPLASLTSIAFTEPLLHNAGYLRFLHRHGAVSNTTTVIVANQTTANKNSTRATTTSTTTTTMDTNTAVTKIRIRRALEFYNTWHRTIAALHVPLLRLEDVDVDMVQTIFAYSTVTSVPTADKIQAALLQKQGGRRRRLLMASHHQNATTIVSAEDTTEGTNRRRRLSLRPRDGRLERRRKRKQRTRHRPGEVRTNQRMHRPRLQWHELCQVDMVLTIEFLELAQSFGYYDEVEDISSVCVDS